MHTTSEMLRSTPDKPFASLDAVSECIQACFETAQVCTACTDSCCSVQHMMEVRHCMRMTMDCADMAMTMGRILSRQMSPDMTMLRRQVECMMATCHACAEECSRHHDSFTRTCMEACRRCEETCKHLLSAMGTHTTTPTH